MATEKAWADHQIKSFAKILRKRHDGGWAYLTPELRSALVSTEVLAITRGQANATIEIAAIDELYTRLHDAMGTTGSVGSAVWSSLQSV